jgi:hypothetical protein
MAKQRECISVVQEIFASHIAGKMEASIGLFRALLCYIQWARLQGVWLI